MNALTLSTMTFLFTDIEGSIRRWEADRTAMARALLRYDTLLQVAISEAGGTIFKTVGDACCAVFDSAAAGVAAATAAQRALAAERWSDFGAGFTAPRVRMALHTGEAEARAGDWFGPPLNRVARLLAAGHGGQVLLSDTVRSLLSGALPEGVSLRDLGQRRLKDLRAPEHVWQLSAPDLMADFPPLATLDARPNNLPGQLTGIIGRESEIAEITGLLRADGGPRLVTLTGPGGTGKTRLALQVAAELIDDFDNGVWWTDLTALANEDLVLPAICAALGLELDPKLTPEAQLAENLLTRRLLLLLDNFEQVVEAAPAVVRLLEGAPGLRVLATSRVSLQMLEERTVEVQPLAVPDTAAGAGPERVMQFAAVQLFVQRVLDLRPDFAMTTETAPAVAEICVRLEGLPLAIELAAARSDRIALPEMLEQLQARLGLLVDGYRDLPRRQQTMRSTILWSYDLLTVEQQSLFRRLGVFRGGWMEEAAAAVAGSAAGEASVSVGDDGSLEEGGVGESGGQLTTESGQASVGGAEARAIDDVEVRDGLAALLRSSLVRVDDRLASVMRFAMSETIREFAAELLLASPERERLLERHLAYYLEYFDQTGQQQPEDAREQASKQMQLEVDNLRAALAHGEAETASAELALQLAQRHMFRLGDLREQVRRMEVLLQRHGTAVTPDLLVLCHWGQGMAATGMLEFSSAERHLRTGLDVARSSGQEQKEAWCLNELGNLMIWNGQLAEAEALMLESIAIKKRLGDWWDVAIGMMNYGLIVLHRGDIVRALELYTESIQVARDSGSRILAQALVNLAEAEVLLGQIEPARTHMEEALSLVDPGDNWIRSFVHTNHVLIHLREGDGLAARSRIALVTHWYVDAENDPHLLEAIELVARTAVLLARPLTAARLGGALEGIRERSKSLARALFHEALVADLALAEAAAGADRFARSFARGKAFTRDELIAAAFAFVDGEEVPIDEADDFNTAQASLDASPAMMRQ